MCINVGQATLTFTVSLNKSILQTRSYLSDERIFVYIY